MADDREADMRLAARWLGWAWDEKRCKVCGWPYFATYCTPESCALRPAPKTTAYDDSIPHFHIDDGAALMLFKAVIAQCHDYDGYIYIWQDRFSCGIQHKIDGHFAASATRFPAEGLAAAICAAVETLSEGEVDRCRLLS